MKSTNENSISPNVQLVTSLEDAGLQPYRTLRRPLEHFQQGIFVAEGEKVVRRLLDSGLEIVSMLMTPEWYTALSQTSNFKPVTSNHSTIIYLAEKQLLESIVGYNLHQGIMAIGKVPRERTIDEILLSLTKPYLLVALDGLVNAENVGVVVRNCAAFGVDAILVGETSSSPYLRRAVRNSMGAVFQIPVLHVASLVETLQTLQKQYHTRVIGTTPNVKRTLHETNLSENVCVVFGNEGEGISQNVLDACSEFAAIPMQNDTDSLNVASASAVVLYEAAEQRARR